MAAFMLVVFGCDAEARVAFAELQQELDASDSASLLVVGNAVPTYGEEWEPLFSTIVVEEDGFPVRTDLETHIRRHLPLDAQVRFRVCFEDDWRTQKLRQFLVGLGWQEFGFAPQPPAPETNEGSCDSDEDEYDPQFQVYPDPPQDENRCPECGCDPCYCEMIAKYGQPGDPGFLDCQTA